MAIIIPANSAADTGFSVANSCRFNDGDSPQLEMDMGDNPTLSTKYSFSCWLKLGAAGTNRCILGEGIGLTAQGDFRIGTDDKLAMSERLASEARYDITTTRVFRDVGAWYNIIWIFDSTQSTASDRIKLYVNGVRETAFDGTPTYPAEDADSQMNQGGALMQVGCQHVHDGSFRNFMDGYMAEVVFIDGTAYAHTDFGEFDEDSPTIWKPKDVSGLTFGANGYYLDFEDSSNLGNDANGGTDFTETNLAAADQSIDSPTNNFCVMNPLTKGSYITLSEGNLLVTGNSATDQASIYGTLSANAGKWYAEAKITVGGTDSYPLVCISHINDQQYGSATNGGNDDPGRYNTASGCYRANGDKRSNNVTSSSWGNSFDDDDIISIAIDCDNGATYVAKNGTWENSGDPTSGGTKTGALVTWTPANEDMSTFTDSQYNSSSSNWNFGSPAFTISSGNADANGYGNFEYAPPAGYLSLCTKNLGSDGG